MGSRLFSSSGDKASIPPFTVPSEGNFVIWLYPTDNSVTRYFWAAVKVGPPAKTMELNWNASLGQVRTGWFYEGVANRTFGSGPLPLNQWNIYHLIWGQNPQIMDLRVNGGSYGGRTDWQDAYWDTSTADYITFGSADGGAVASARASHVTIWNDQESIRSGGIINDLAGTLNETDLRGATHPLIMFPQYVIGHWPCEGLFSPEPDLSDGGRPATVTGTTVVENGPPIGVDAPHDFLQLFPAAATAGNRADLFKMFTGPIPGFGTTELAPRCQPQIHYTPRNRRKKDNDGSERWGPWHPLYHLHPRNPRNISKPIRKIFR